MGRRVSRNDESNGGVSVIYDPDKLGGFWPGASFSVSECISMLRLGNFTPGTVLRIQSNQKPWRMSGEYVVQNRGKYNFEQEVVVMEDHKCILMEIGENGAKGGQDG